VNKKVKTTFVIAAVVFSAVALAETAQFAARGTSEAEGCTKAHNKAVEWMNANSWKWTAKGLPAPSEGQCHCNGDSKTGYYCEVPVSG
jgi:hypothetical protein